MAHLNSSATPAPSEPSHSIEWRRLADAVRVASRPARYGPALPAPCRMACLHIVACATPHQPWARKMQCLQPSARGRPWARRCACEARKVLRQGGVPAYPDRTCASADARPSPFSCHRQRAVLLEQIAPGLCCTGRPVQQPYSPSTSFQAPLPAASHSNQPPLALTCATPARTHSCAHRRSAAPATSPW